MKNIKKDIIWRADISFLIIAMMGLAVIARIIYLQTIKRPQLEQLAENLSMRYVNINPIRGNLYAEDGSLIATSIPIYEARFDTRASNYQDFKEGVDSLAWHLSDYFKDKSAKEYKKILWDGRNNKSRYLLIKRRLNHLQIKDLKKFPIFRLGKYKGGLIAVQESRRILPFGQLAKRTIGYYREDIKPVGLEGAFNSYLEGTTGKRLMQKIGYDSWIPINKDNEIDPKDGQDIITTIDVNFQDITEQALKKVLLDNGAAHGCAVVMETSTGKIKAIANLNRTKEGEYIEGYNYAIGASTEPGSTFKLITAMALLELNKANPKTKYDTKDGTVSFYNRTMKDSKKGGHGVVSLKEAFEVSSNVAISEAAFNAFSKKPSEFINFINSLGIGKPIGLHIKGEGRPVIKSPTDKDWSGTTLPWMSIGYELRLTPLQLLTVYNAVANNGKMMKPMFVNEIQDAGKTIIKFHPEVTNPKICSDNTLVQLRQMLEGVVEEGTATNIKNNLFPIAGKTGTAQIADKNKGYQNVYQSSFAGFFPANKPEYSCIVVVSLPSSGRIYGAIVAAPAFSEIAQKIYARSAKPHNLIASFIDNSEPYLPIATKIRKNDLSTLMGLYPANTGLQVASDENIWVNAEAKKNIITTKNISENTDKVPDVNGMVLSDAVYFLENAGLKVRYSGMGKVISQSLAAGSLLERNNTIEIVLN